MCVQPSSYNQECQIPSRPEKGRDGTGRDIFELDGTKNFGTGQDGTEIFGTGLNIFGWDGTPKFLDGTGRDGTRYF